MFNKKILIIGGASVVLVAIVIALVFALSGKGGKYDVSDSNVLYYTCGMHPSVKVSPEEYEKGNTTCPICNMKLVPVLKEDGQEMTGSLTGKDEENVSKRKILFYRNPMNPSITSEVPTKDEMGMDYIPVYEESKKDGNYYGCGMEGAEHVFLLEDAEGMKCPICGMPLKKLTPEEAKKLKGVAGEVKIKGEELKLAGVETESLGKLPLFREIRTVGRVAYDSNLAIAEEEYVSALRALDKINRGGIPEIKARASSLVDAAINKLKLLGLSNDQIDELKKTRKVHTNLVLPESKMWIYGEVYEYELGWLKNGQKIKVTSPAFPGEDFEGTITSINPVVDPKTRSVRFRAEVNNHDLKLKPDMYVNIIVMSSAGKENAPILAVPKNAVLDTGRRKIVWFDRGDGSFEGREMVLGPESSATINGKSMEYYPVIRGAKEGELVVTKSNFLIDSQSQISGTASSAYGGALGKDNKEEEEEEKLPVHQH